MKETKRKIKRATSDAAERQSSTGDRPPTPGESFAEIQRLRDSVSGKKHQSGNRYPKRTREDNKKEHSDEGGSDADKNKLKITKTSEPISQSGIKARLRLFNSSLIYSRAEEKIEYNSKKNLEKISDILDQQKQKKDAEQSQGPKELVTFRVEPALKALIDQAVHDRNLPDRTAWLTETITDTLARQGYDVSTLQEQFSAKASEEPEQPKARRRIQRTPDQLPDKTQSPRAYVNREDKTALIRIEPALLDAINAATQQQGMDRKAWIKEAVDNFLACNAQLPTTNKHEAYSKILSIPLDSQEREIFEKISKKYDITMSDLIRRIAKWQLSKGTIAPEFPEP